MDDGGVDLVCSINGKATTKDRPVRHRTCSYARWYSACQAAQKNRKEHAQESDRQKPKWDDISSCTWGCHHLLSSAVGFIRHQFHWKEHKKLQWTLDEKLQLQPMAYEEAGQGHWSGGASSCACH